MFVQLAIINCYQGILLTVVIHLKQLWYIHVPSSLSLPHVVPFLPLTPDFSQCVRQSENGRVARVFLTFTQPYSVNIIRYSIVQLGLQCHACTASCLPLDRQLGRFNTTSKLDDNILLTTQQMLHFVCNC